MNNNGHMLSMSMFAKVIKCISIVAPPIYQICKTIVGQPAINVIKYNYSV